MSGGASSRVLSRIQGHNKSPDIVCSSPVDGKERADSEPSSSRWKKSLSSSGLNQKSAEKRGHSSGRSPSIESKKPMK